MHAYFCIAAYKGDVVVVIKMGAYIHGVLIIPILLYLQITEAQQATSSPVTAIGISCIGAMSIWEALWET